MSNQTVSRLVGVVLDGNVRDRPHATASGTGTLQKEYLAGVHALRQLSMVERMHHDRVGQPTGNVAGNEDLIRIDVGVACDHAAGTKIHALGPLSTHSWL